MRNPSTNKIAVVVLNWNGTEDTIACLTSLVPQTYGNFEIIVVDNGSNVQAVEELDRFIEQFHFPTTYLKNETNRGFAGGVNTGITAALKAGFDAIALLNNDAVADPEWLASLAGELTKNEVAIVTGALFHDDHETIDSTGEFYSIWGLPFPRDRNEPIDSAPAAGYIFGATGGATLYRAELFNDIGLFDEDFFAYYEDVDISFRAQLAGYRIYYTPSAIAYHKRGASTKRMPGFPVYQAFKNLPLVFIKNVPHGLLIRIGVRLFVAYWLILGKAIVVGNGLPALRGWAASLGLVTKALSERRAIQQKRKVSVDYISSVLWPDLPPHQTSLRKLRWLFTGKS